MTGVGPESHYYNMRGDGTAVGERVENVHECKLTG